jgi:hypothetical protein
MNVAGSGLLVGTALSVIIPEGVSALYSQKHHEEHHGTEALIDEHEGDHGHEDEDHQHDEVIWCNYPHFVISHFFTKFRIDL